MCEFIVMEILSGVFDDNIYMMLEWFVNGLLLLNVDDVIDFCVVVGIYCVVWCVGEMV